MNLKFILSLAFAVVMVPSFAVTTVLANSPSLPGDSFTNSLSSNTGQAIGASGWYYNNVRNNGIVGINNNYARNGLGSMYLETTQGPGGLSSKADAELWRSPTQNGNGNYGLGNTSQSLGALANLSALSYDWYRDSISANSAVQHPSLRLFIGNQSNTQFGYIIFERVYNGGTVLTDQWVSDDIFANRTSYNMWSTGSLPNSNDFNVKLSDWMSSSQNYQVYAVSSGVGSGWGTFRGAVDNVGVGFSGANSVYNFEPVPEPATMTAMAMGALALLRKRRKA